MIALFLALAAADPFSDGVAAYDRGEWDVAAEQFSAVENPSGPVRFNLGNAWFQSGDLPRAIAAWRSAARIRPRDGEIAHNLALARAGLGDRPPPVDPTPRWSALVTPEEVGAVGVFALVAAAFALWRRHGAWGVGLWTTGLLLGAIALSGQSAARRHPVAVVVDAPARVRDAARADGAVRFELREGTEIRVERSLSGFVLVTTGDGRRGWAPEGAIAR